jgi:hypothetical protein
MKFTALIGATAAVRLGDAPPFFNEPTWRETFPSAAGLSQNSMSSEEAFHNCEIEHGLAYPCEDNLFATGMNGDEDLGQDIIMKGDKFHYQQDLAQA